MDLCDGSKLPKPVVDSRPERRAWMIALTARPIAASPNENYLSGLGFFAGFRRESQNRKHGMRVEEHEKARGLDEQASCMQRKRATLPRTRRGTKF